MARALRAAPFLRRSKRHVLPAARRADVAALARWAMRRATPAAARADRGALIERAGRWRRHHPCGLLVSSTRISGYRRKAYRIKGARSGACSSSGILPLPSGNSSASRASASAPQLSTPGITGVNVPVLAYLPAAASAFRSTTCRPAITGCPYRVSAIRDWLLGSSVGPIHAQRNTSRNRTGRDCFYRVVGHLASFVGSHHNCAASKRRQDASVALLRWRC